MHDTEPSPRDAEDPVCTTTLGPDWDALIEQFQPLINSVCRQFRLGSEDAADVSQDVWLKVFINLSSIRDPRALPGWIKTTTTNAACGVIRARHRVALLADPGTTNATILMSSSDGDVDAHLLRAERCEAVRQGVAELPPRTQELVGLLAADPPIPYEQISSQMNMPIGSIGPTRARCLSKLANTATIQALTRDAA
ncbi:RNA polymerase sigma factor [Microlunatus ginsengisoli]|uniref:Sigma-70 family RNA polymerase sigma factor n=1 Tax=Microlunatus ginsengisoli TaxID=363863 RepID=A0ABP7A280_9ACTN